MQLQPEEFDRFLNSIGQSFDWRSAAACPCVNTYSGAPNPDCTHCYGKGRFWAVAVNGTAGIVGRNQLKKFAQFGEWDAGDTMISIPSDSPLYAIGQYDRLVAVDRSEPFSMNLVYGVNDIIRFPVIELDKVFWIDADDNMVEGDLPTINSDGTLTWGATQPAAQATFSLTGRRHPEYFVYIDLPLDRPFHHGANLPRRCVLRRFDLYGR